MINLQWKETSHPDLSEIEKQVVIDKLNSLASKFPRGFDVTFTTDIKDQILKFIRKELNVVFVEVGQDADSFCIAGYQNESDLENRESQR